jgi:acetate---CoA ligase (ADP-forming)
MTSRNVGFVDPSGNLDRLFCPRSVAVVGASDTAGSIGGKAFQNLVAGEFAGPVYPVNARAPRVAGHRAYPNVREVPGPVDLAVVSVPLPHVISTVEDCAAIGVGGIVMLSAGFAESGAEGKRLQQRLEQAVRDAGIRLCGPNCAGFANADLGVRANFATHPLPSSPSGVALATQSGGLAGFGLPAAAHRGAPIGWWISTGNEVDVTVSAALRYLVELESVTVLLGFLESLPDPEEFVAAALRATELAKPLIVLKGARSDLGARAAQSHTAAIAGSSVVFGEVCRQYGVISVRSLEEMVDIALAFAAGRRLEGAGVGILTASGGTGVMMADAAAEAGLTVPVLPASARDDLAALIPTPFYGSTHNPVDMTGSVSRRPESFAEVLDGMARSPDLDALSPVLFHASPVFVQGLLGVYDRTDKPMAVLATVSPPDLMDARVPCFPDPWRAMRALGALHEHARWVSSAEPAWPHRVEVARQARARAILAGRAEGSGPMADERQALDLLSAYGIGAVEEILATTADAAVAAFAEIGAPVAMKIRADQVGHKSDLGGVVLNVSSADAVRAAYAQIMGAAGRSLDGFAVRGVVVQPMVAASLELAIGVVRDPAFGPVVFAGLGGVLIEIVRARVGLRPPFGPPSAHRALARLLDGRLTGSPRGLHPAQEAALAQAMCAVGELALELPEIVSLDVNPLVFRDGRLCALDALVVIDTVAGDTVAGDTVAGAVAGGGARGRTS